MCTVDSGDWFHIGLRLATTKATSTRGDGQGGFVMSRYRGFHGGPPIRVSCRQRPACPRDFAIAEINGVSSDTWCGRRVRPGVRGFVREAHFKKRYGCSRLAPPTQFLMPHLAWPSHLLAESRSKASVSCAELPKDRRFVVPSINLLIELPCDDRGLAIYLIRRK